MPPNAWKLAGHVASLHVDHFTAVLDVFQPSRGLKEVVLDGSPLEGAELCRVAMTSQPAGDEDTLADCYLRGDDLVATYAATPTRDVRTQVYWRAVHPDKPGVVAGVEAIISVQTDLLDSRPKTVCSCRLPADEVLRLTDTSPTRFDVLPGDSPRPLTLDNRTGTGLFLWRLPQTGFTYVTMVYPADFDGADLAINLDDRAAVLTYRLFPQHLEKGVIRRGRVRGLFVRRQDDTRTAAECYAAFSLTKLPLTA